MTICRYKQWAQLCRFDVAKFFVVCAILLNGIYMSYISPLSTLYLWSAQRFFHAVHIADTLLGKPDTLPVSMLQLLAEVAPKHLHNVSGIMCRRWEEDVKKAYCMPLILLNE